MDDSHSDDGNEIEDNMHLATIVSVHRDLLNRWFLEFGVNAEKLDDETACGVMLTHPEFRERFPVIEKLETIENDDPMYIQLYAP